MTPSQVSSDKFRNTEQKAAPILSESQRDILQTSCGNRKSKFYSEEILAELETNYSVEVRKITETLKWIQKSTRPVLLIFPGHIV